MTPAGRFFTQFFDEAMKYFDYPMRDIEWEQGAQASQSSNVNGEVLNTEKKFEILMDASDFLPVELTVIYDEVEREVVIEGHQKERTDRIGSIEKHFRRKFALPEDTCSEGLAAFLVTSKKQLRILAPKKSVGPLLRRLPIQVVTELAEEDGQINEMTCEKQKFSDEGIGEEVTSEITEQKEELNAATCDSDVKQVIEKDVVLSQQLDGPARPKRLPKIKREYLNIFC